MMRPDGERLKVSWMEDRRDVFRDGLIFRKFFSGSRKDWKMYSESGMGSRMAIFMRGTLMGGDRGEKVLRGMEAD